MTIFGSDHSRYDWMTGNGTYSPIDWTKSRAAFAFLKACDGYADTLHYADEITAARKAGKLAAPYVWLYQDAIQNVNRQADFWYDRLKNEPLIAIDFEGYSNSYPNANDLYNAIERLRADGYAGKIIIYTGHWYWLVYGNTQSYWNQFPVWLARYATEPPQPTPPWTGYDIWQFSSTGDPATYGVTNGKKAVDENRFEGTPEQLAALFGGVPTPPEPPGGDMNTVTVVWSAGANVRTAPNTSSTILRTLANGTVLQTAYNETMDASGNRWIRISDAQEYIATFYGGVLRASVVPVVIPPVNETATVTVEHNGKTGTAVIELK